MRIVIETDGTYQNTSIELNGGKSTAPDIKELHFSIHEGGRPKLQMTRMIDGLRTFISFFGADFAKNDEIEKQQENLKQ
jgi:hypothetical protein